ncbi:DUF1579 domain-containing protein [Novipirellula sp.]|uniref:DUF1579 domain-containing protein n=2 Tax=Novipirellula sp. TaxID=2795430 RepID=UPI003567B5AD
MFAKPQSEHHWLDQLIGKWSLQHECKMPDGNTSMTTGKIECRSLGGMWLVAESSGESAEGDAWSSIMTLGFDIAQKRYVGTFVGSMMSNIWYYQGIRDADGTRLPLVTEGPKFDGSGTCPYRDTIEIIDADCWLMNSAMQTDDGNWVTFMNGTHKRT